MHPETCPNCGTELRGPFCHECGQKDLDLDRPFLSLLGEWLGNLFAFDARVWRTLYPLMTRPGFLTAEYLAGRRAHYVPPLRLYFFASIAMFLALAWSGHSIVSSSQDGETPIKVYTVEGVTVEGGEEPASTQQGEPAEPGGEASWFEERMARVGEAPPETVNTMYRQRLAQTLILLAFVFALITRGLYWNVPLFQHLIFSVHLHAAAFAGIFAVNGLGRLVDLASNAVGIDDWAVGIFSLGYLLAIPVYVFIALRKVFARSRLATFWRFALLLVTYLISLSVTLMITMLLTAAVL